MNSISMKNSITKIFVVATITYGLAHFGGRAIHPINPHHAALFSVATLISLKVFNSFASSTSNGVLSRFFSMTGYFIPYALSVSLQLMSPAAAATADIIASLSIAIIYVGMGT